IAITYEGNGTTYRELCSAVAVLADAYARHSIQPGDRVLCALANRPEYVIVMMAVWMHGAVHVGVDADLPHAELRRIASFTGAKVLVHAGTPLLSGSTACDGRGGPIVTLLDGNGDALDHQALRDWLDRSSHRHSDLPSCAPRAPDSALATLFLTHGTTGQPKF